jgi:hypothetical protein
MIARALRRGRGRPPKDDQLLRELALAAEVAYGLGPQQARDWAVAVMEARPARPTKLPRVFRKAPAGSKLVGYELPLATFAGRETAIRQKIRREGGECVATWSWRCFAFCAPRTRT